MDNIQFCKTFSFCEFSFKRQHHTDNSSGTKCHHIGYIKSGSAIFDVSGTVYEFSEGDVFYTPPGCKYHSYWTGDSIVYDSYAFHVFPSRRDEEYGVQKLHMTERARTLLLALTQKKAVNCHTVGLLYEFLGEVLTEMTPTVRDSQRELLSKARRYMREHIDCTVPELARHIGVSESGVYLLFKKKAGTTPITEKNRIRVEMAAELLATTDISVEEISFRLGFSSAAYFRKVLRAFYGKTPREMRKIKNI